MTRPANYIVYVPPECILFNLDVDHFEVSGLRATRIEDRDLWGVHYYRYGQIKNECINTWISIQMYVAQHNLVEAYRG